VPGQRLKLEKENAKSECRWQQKNEVLFLGNSKGPNRGKGGEPGGGQRSRARQDILRQSKDRKRGKVTAGIYSDNVGKTK